MYSYCLKQEYVQILNMPIMKRNKKKTKKERTKKKLVLLNIPLRYNEVKLRNNIFQNVGQNGVLTRRNYGFYFKPKRLLISNITAA